MRHHNANRKFGRKTGVRRAFLQSLSRALVMEGRIVTTEARAKEIRPLVERMVTTAKNGETVPSVRLLTSRMGGQKDVAFKIVNDLAPKYKERAGGYTRILKLPRRSSDGAPMALIEFV
jgi:large subunit ribosomal protein L17